MNPSRSPASSARSKSADAYHHGDLREALLAAAREALETTAPEQISLKALATRLGVSQPAPYRHFASREALLQAVAEDGFLRFAAALRAADDEGGSTVEAMRRGFLAYIRFGQANRGVYRLMFASPLLPASEPGGGLQRASHGAFSILLEQVGAHMPPQRARAIAIWIWSTLHGIVMLDAQGLLRGPPDDPVTVEQVVDELVSAVHARI
jgi:AcrR family transcriptional regulator